MELLHPFCFLSLKGKKHVNAEIYFKENVLKAMIILPTIIISHHLSVDIYLQIMEICRFMST